MRKIFTFLFAALMSVGMYATTVVTITLNDFPSSGNSFTKDGVTVSAGMIESVDGNIMDDGSFSTTLGNFTKIEVNADYIEIAGEGWSGDSRSQTWTGNASSVSFSGDIMGDGLEITLKFTIEEPEPEPQPAEPIVVTWNNSDISGSGNSFTKDGVTITCGGINWGYPDFYGPGTFTTDLGNFTKIEITADMFEMGGAGWTEDYQQQTWTGNAASVSFNGGMYIISSIVFTIEPAAASEPGATAVEDVQGNQVQATKFFRNGMLLIEKNGKIYNVMGAEVK